MGHLTLSGDIFDAVTARQKILKRLLAFNTKRPGVLVRTPLCTGQLPKVVDSCAQDASSADVEKPCCWADGEETRASGEATGREWRGVGSGERSHPAFIVLDELCKRFEAQLPRLKIGKRCFAGVFSLR